jgi:predicted nucleic acid-binding protein
MVYYLDTSAWIAWKFRQSGNELFDRIDMDQDTVVSSPLLVAEYLSFLKRNGRLSDTRYEDELGFIRWIHPVEPMFQSCTEVALKTELWGADLYHLATAVWFAEDFRKDLKFLSCDGGQKKAAQKLGFS